MAIRHYAPAFALSALSGFAIWGALQVPEALPGETWAGIVPLGAAIALGLISLLEVLSAYRTQLKPAQTAGLPQVLSLFLLALCYQGAFSAFGYLLPTAVAAPLALYLFGVRKPLGLLVAALLCPLLFHVIFFVLLGVYPPYGEVFDLGTYLGNL
ncbi:MAG: tripartite tricarboxylate transporter TctB family protein [Pseudomonadales bacterium]